MHDDNLQDDFWEDAERGGDPALTAANVEPQRATLVPWWQCRRRGAVSGRYAGDEVGGSGHLVLRVDIDPRSTNSPTMRRLSGDLYRAFSFGQPGKPALKWRTYRESFIVDNPTVTWSRCSVVVTGTVRFWKGSHPQTAIQVRIPWGSLQPAGPAEVAFTPLSARAVHYVCPRVSDCFRDVHLEVDVTTSVNQGPLLPAYDTHWHATRPQALVQRAVDVAQAYWDAGIKLTVDPQHTVIDDTDPQFTSWSPAELHDALETHFSRFGQSWPRWEMWGLMCGRFDNSGTGGIMFDAAGTFGGAGQPPERQGFAVFRDHQWFQNLVAGTPANEAEARAMRHFLYTWVHEAGHAFNFLHSWDKNRPDSLSWMNYDWRYDQRNGADGFWGGFEFRFDDEELIHMRHGDRVAVIMGGDPWSSGSHLDTPSDAFAQTEGSPPLELLIRSKEYFEFLEPVSVELRLRNVLPDAPLTVDRRLDPQFGAVAVFIQRPSKQVVQYAPIFCQLATAETATLLPLGAGPAGSDRYSEEVRIGYGQYGFYFDEPGEYLVRAVYQGAGDVLITSNVHRVRVGRPWSREEDRLAQDFFASETGLSLYLGGSRSRHLAKGLNLLEEMIARYGRTIVGAKLATAVAPGIGRRFFSVGGEALQCTHAADPEGALAITAPALEVFRQEPHRALNLSYHRLVKQRARLHRTIGKPEAARQEFTTLRSDLAQRGVNAAVLADIAVAAQQSDGPAPIGDGSGPRPAVAKPTTSRRTRGVPA